MASIIMTNFQLEKGVLILNSSIPLTVSLHFAPLYPGEVGAAFARLAKLLRGRVACLVRPGVVLISIMEHILYLFVYYVNPVT